MPSTSYLFAVMPRHKPANERIIIVPVAKYKVAFFEIEPTKDKKGVIKKNSPKNVRAFITNDNNELKVIAERKELKTENFGEFLKSIEFKSDDTSLQATQCDSIELSIDEENLTMNFNSFSSSKQDFDSLSLDLNDQIDEANHYLNDYDNSFDDQNYF